MNGVPGYETRFNFIQADRTSLVLRGNYFKTKKFSIINSVL